MDKEKVTHPKFLFSNNANAKTEHPDYWPLRAAPCRVVMGGSSTAALVERAGAPTTSPRGCSLPCAVSELPPLRGRRAPPSLHRPCATATLSPAKSGEHWASTSAPDAARKWIRIRRRGNQGGQVRGCAPTAGSPGCAGRSTTTLLIRAHHYDAMDFASWRKTTQICVLIRLLPKMHAPFASSVGRMFFTVHTLFCVCLSLCMSCWRQPKRNQ